MSAVDRPPPITPSSCFNYKNRSCFFLNALRITLLVVGILILAKTGALAQVSAGWGTTLIVLVALSVIIPFIVNRCRNSQRAAQEEARLAAIRIPIPTYDELVNDPSHHFSETIKPEDNVQIAVAVGGPGILFPHFRECESSELEPRQIAMDSARKAYASFLRQGYLCLNVKIVFEKLTATSQPTGQKYEFTSSLDHRQRTD